MSERLYKVLGPGGVPCHGGTGKWSLPTKGDDGTWTPGEWMPAIGSIKPCERGYHLCREDDLIQWLNAEIYEAEYQGQRIDADDNVVVGEARLLRRFEVWNDHTAREFACDCAEDVLSIWERYYPDDQRPRQCIEVARRYARGEATDDERAAAQDAAWAAARDAAWDAAWAAAWDAAWAAAWDAARDTAWAAARAAAWDAARDTAWAAAWAAAWDAQTERLLALLEPQL